MNVYFLKWCIELCRMKRIKHAIDVLIKLASSFKLVVFVECGGQGIDVSNRN